VTDLLKGHISRADSARVFCDMVNAMAKTDPGTYRVAFLDSRAREVCWPWYRAFLLPGEVADAVKEYKAAGVIIGFRTYEHSPLPTGEDLEFVAELTAMVGVPVLDFTIFSNHGLLFYSLRREGHMQALA